jgi:hypothetical protein
LFLVCNLANSLFIFKVKIQSNWALGNPEESLPPNIQKKYIPVSLSYGINKDGMLYATKQ